MDIERRIFTSQVELRMVGDSNMAVGYGAVFNSMSEDLGGFREIIAPGAFDSVMNDDVRGLINHDPNLILGRTKSGTMRISVDATGLRYEIDMPSTSYANDIRESLSRGDITQSSFAFSIDGDDWAVSESGETIRTIKKVSKLYDVSVVTYPAYPEAQAGIKRMMEFSATRQSCVNAEHELIERELELIGLLSDE